MHTSMAQPLVGWQYQHLADARALAVRVAVEHVHGGKCHKRELRHATLTNMPVTESETTVKPL